jgi:2-C-methyl-D-erythritol 4-phosphate cytidylyltransferase
MNAGIIVAAGKSTRMGTNVDKAFLSLGTKPVLAYSLMAFEACEDIDAIVVVVRKDRVAAARGLASMYGCSKVIAVVAGGASRQASVSAGVKELDDATKLVAIHDGARPCVTPALISETLKAAKRYGSGVAATKISDTVKLVERGLTVNETLDRNKLWAAQTPQSFKLDLLTGAYEALAAKKETVTDDAAALEMMGESVRLVASTPCNMKITCAEDLPLAASLLRV